MVKFSKEQIQKLRCICGNCQHDWHDSGCLYNKISDARDPQEELEKQIVSLVEDVVKKSLNNTKTTKCDKMKPKGKKEINGKLAK